MLKRLVKEYFSSVSICAMFNRPRPAATKMSRISGQMTLATVW